MSDQRTVQRSAVVAVLAAAVMVLLAACGGGEVETDATVERDDAPTSEELADAGGLLTDADCQQYVEAFGQPPSVTDPGSLDGIQQTADVLDDAADRVPDEISDDFRVIASAYRVFADAFVDMNLDFTDPAAVAALGAEDLAKLEAAGQAMSSAEVQEATDNLEAFLAQHCT